MTHPSDIERALALIDAEMIADGYVKRDPGSWVHPETGSVIIDPYKPRYLRALLSALRTVEDERERMREAQALIRDMLPYIEPARLREEADAREGKAIRMPVRAIIRRVEALPSAPVSSLGEGK